MANPDYEKIWEEGTVTSISDGDTLVANLDAGSGARGSNRVRTIGVQAPEVAHNGTPAECGAAQATDRLRAQLPVGMRVQTRSVDVASSDSYSSGRIVRSLYAQDEEGNWYDTSRGTVSDGWMMWFPLAADSSNKPEWAHNLEYRVLADDAAGQGRGLWSQGLCGPWQQSASAWNRPDSQLRVWAQYYGTEKVFVENRGPSAVDLSGWIIRDSAISGYRTLPANTVIPPGEARLVYSGDLNLNNLPADNPAFEGDAVYLLEPAGALATGNLRAWFPYPCNPDECGDPLVGQVSISRVQDTPPPVTNPPSAPGSVQATATTDGTGTVTVTWAAPADLQAPSVTYTITPSSLNGGSPLTAATNITGLSHTFTGLTLGRAYSFSVVAVNTAGASNPASTTSVVTPIGLPRDPGSATPRPPTDIVVEGRGTSAVVSWTAPVGAGGEPAIGYSVTAAPQDAARTCSTTAGQTSCVVPNLVDDGITLYTFTVTATLGTATSSATSAPTLSAYKPGAAPITEPLAVTALAGDKRAVVSWLKPASDGGTPITEYKVTAAPKPSGPGTCTTGGATSCQIGRSVQRRDLHLHRGGTEQCEPAQRAVGSQPGRVAVRLCRRAGSDGPERCSALRHGPIRECGVC